MKPVEYSTLLPPHIYDHTYDHLYYWMTGIYISNKSVCFVRMFWAPDRRGTAR